MVETALHIVERNRVNALHSTGPRSAEGKAIARTNATKHGLCANPAAGAVEDPSQFEELHAQVVKRLCPEGPIEEGLVHRIAVCLWRLQRSARIDAAAGSLAVTGVPDEEAELQRWIGILNCEGWYAQLYPDDTSERSRHHPKGERPLRFMRPWLNELDRLREQEMPHTGPAIAAMECMLRDLANQLANQESNLLPVEAQQLAWLLGDSAARLRVVEGYGDRGLDEFFYPDEHKWASEIDRLIGEARKRPRGHALPRRLKALIQCHLATLRQQRLSISNATTIDRDHRRTAALLPETPILDRLLRYETHADRTLQRCLETLARTRGWSGDDLRAALRPGVARIQIVTVRDGGT